MRISTTVDGAAWERARRLMNSPASQILDRALQVLIESVEAERELSALERFPYEADSAVSWEGDPGPDLPYEGEVPEEILRLAAEKRRARTG